ncbi:DUF3891 family protein [Pueribacillus theae]|uniref:DUF3891 family protein n=1 Tax=Pueribacillus theae TaxID=2171751 RepID=UPI001402FCF2|nr:DUF3891 family protein [Pueribacillus theae]
MIVKEYETHYELIKQHDHAKLAGEMAFHTGNPPFKHADFKTVMVAALHDYSWIESDSHLHEGLYDFTNYPMAAKLKLYKKGIDEMEKIDEYVALLTSLHYTAFFKAANEREISQFLTKEKERQQHLMNRYRNEDVELALEHLKMWDNCSLYVCLNEPGAKKVNEHPWFKNGINGISASGANITIECKWKDEQTIAFSPFPFLESWTAAFPVYHCEKPIKNDSNPFNKSTQRKITFVPE